MPTIEIPAVEWRPSGGRIVVTDRDTLIRPAPGLAAATILGGVLFKPGSDGSLFAPSVTLRAVAEDTWRGEGLVMICANRIFAPVTVDAAGLSCQGVHVSDWYGNTPEAGDLSGLRVTGIPYTDTVGKDHCVYFRAGRNFTGTNLYLSSAGGGGLHFYSADQTHVVTGNVFTQVTYDRCFADTYTWGPGCYGNVVTRQLSLNVGPRGHNVDDGTVRNDVSDYVTVPTPGYGYVAPSPAVTDADRARAAEQHLRATTIDYRTWADRVANGWNGKPYDPSKTEWGKAFAELAKIV